MKKLILAASYLNSTPVILEWNCSWKYLFNAIKISASVSLLLCHFNLIKAEDSPYKGDNMLFQSYISKVFPLQNR